MSRTAAAFDLARPESDISALVVVTRVFDRWKLHDFWLVEFEYFDATSGQYTRDSRAFDRKVDAMKFTSGSLVAPDEEYAGPDDELPF